ncbi:DISARM system phospholipase D-like protein DrmC [Alcanivorax sp. JB21]|uniref:DISARM system phospholipase D-like protein DrmC n=1 Tax=Alcanivorax limicola TaxID=2874102 RepID=UPI001CBF9A54|nr:DISARM system phospholipase D-like protein DrmC [Alcanivorax limicola]MBZ2187846.1 DISARM system phospholipase D-like protein DrmC [Alcanivorax limicola]
MEKLLDAVAALVFLVSPEKVQAIAGRIRRTDPVKVPDALSSAVSTPVAAEIVDQLINAWQSTSVSAEELALMLLAAGHVMTKAANQQSVELVWTGPTTPFVSARRTEQSLLQVINSAEHTLFITSFVAYDVASVIKALNAAAGRGVAISILLERSQSDGGSISFDAIAKMKVLVPEAKIFTWGISSEPFSGGSVHAKIAVSDDHRCLITSANLTGHAMEKNMEAGVLISGGIIPKALSNHLKSLVAMKVISPIYEI